MVRSHTSGCGKSVILAELAAATGNHDMVTVVLDDQMDAKSLTGAYVCTAVPGEFIWQPGPITQVIISHKTILAPSDHCVFLR
jgi:midasin